MTRPRLIVLALLLLAVALFFALDGGRWFSLAGAKALQADVARAYAADPLAVAAAYFAIYVAGAALSLPGSAILTLLGGAVFGLGVGVVVVSFASSIGATLAMLVARYLLRDAVQARFGERLAEVDAGVARAGAFYLFTLRLVPAIPFFVVNLAMGLTAMPARRFYWVSQLGMLPATLVFVNAGQHLAQIESVQGVLSPGLVGSFVLLGVFPLLARKGVALWQRRHATARWAGRRPRRFDRNLIVIGGGAAGLVSAYLASALKASVTLVERQRMGGDCLNTGCVPSKALIRSAALAQAARDAAAHGVQAAPVHVDFAAVMDRVAAAVKTIEPHDSVERYRSLGVDVRVGEARLVDPWRVQITAPDGQATELSTRAIVIASGAEPVVPDLPGLDACGYLTSETLWSLRELPPRLLVLGGGPVGCELAQAFARLGSQVTLVEAAPRLLPREDDEVSDFVAARLRAEGVELRLAHRALHGERAGDERCLQATGPGGDVRLPFDRLLCAVGRRPRLEGLGLEALGLLRADGSLAVNDAQQTAFGHILAAGDVAGPYRFTHAAAHQATTATLNGLFGFLRTTRSEYRVMPWVTYLDPEVARVGLNERDARDQGVAVELTRLPLSRIDRAVAEGRTEGWIQVLTPPGRDRILGATIVGAHAGEMLAPLVLAMKHDLGLKALLGTIHAYPSWTEATRAVAGEWQRQHPPRGALQVLAWLHAWRRGGPSKGMPH